MVEVKCEACGKVKSIHDCRLKSNKSGKVYGIDCAPTKKKDDIIVKCAWCGEDTKITHMQLKNSKTGNFFCDAKCMGKYRYANYVGEKNPTFSSVEVKCSYCGNPKLEKPCRIKTTQNFFCNPECYAKWTSENKSGENSYAWKGGPIQTNCSMCNKEIYVAKCLFEKHENNFCSDECKNSFHSIKMSGDGNSNWRGGLIDTKCSYCNSDLKILQCKIDQATHFCDKICQGKYNSKFRSGPNNQNWKGGISFEPYPFEFNSELKLKIRERDGFTCQLCGVKENGRALDVHHINYDKQDCSEKNLISLCQQGNGCHQKTNGNREYWKEDVEDWMKENHPEYF